MILTATEIQEIIPHRYPLFLVDRIIELEPLKRAVGIKCVTMNEEFFNGHFPGHPVMPGVLILEAMAQVGGISMLYPDQYRGMLAFFAGIDKAKFRQPVVPGDQLRMVSEVVRLRGTVGRVWAEAFVEEKLVAEAEFTFALAHRKNNEKS